MMFESICQFDNHGLKPILGVCTNLTCKKFRPYCHQCLIEFHFDHITEIKDLHQISFWSQSCAPLQEQLIQSINQYSSIVDQLTNLKNSLQFDCSIDLSLLRLSDLNNHINSLVNLSSIQDFIQDIFNKSQDQLEMVTMLCKETISLQQYKENIYYQEDKPEELLDDIQILAEINEIKIESIEKKSNIDIDTNLSQNDTNIKTPEKQPRLSLNDSNIKTPEKQTGNQMPKIRNSEQNSKVKSNQNNTSQIRSQSYKNQISTTQQRNSISNLKKIINQPKQQQVQTLSKEQNYMLQLKVIQPEKDKQKTIKTQENEITSPSNQSSIFIQQQEPLTTTTIIQQQGFRFSENLRSQRTKLQKNCKIAIGSGGFVLCEPCIPMEGQSQFEILIDKCDLVYLGICSKFIVQTYNFEPNIQAFDTHGSYLISNNGFSYSCMEQELNNVKQKLNFSSGDKITITVNFVSSLITWKTMYKKLFTMRFDNTKEMYVCVKFQRLRFSNDSQVEILNYELNN
ncbi:unnamed protein product [Paramecium pentaurelia]|uniref:Uncharacterized protein n=1 Tax=Paramecium pentaurelia TaxID=43138 RepID=A0A8S1UWN5_9CILI|nr:unnamed protein product [Paramecium pentaurelia]